MRSFQEMSTYFRRKLTVLFCLQKVREIRLFWCTNWVSWLLSFEGSGRQTVYTRSTSRLPLKRLRYNGSNELWKVMWKVGGIKLYPPHHIQTSIQFAQQTNINQLIQCNTRLFYILFLLFNSSLFVVLKHMTVVGFEGLLQFHQKGLHGTLFKHCSHEILQ